MLEVYHQNQSLIVITFIDFSKDLKSINQIILSHFPVPWCLRVIINVVSFIYNRNKSCVSIYIVNIRDDYMRTRRWHNDTIYVYRSAELCTAVFCSWITDAYRLPDLDIRLRLCGGCCSVRLHCWRNLPTKWERQTYKISWVQNQIHRINYKAYITCSQSAQCRDHWSSQGY